MAQKKPTKDEMIWAIRMLDEITSKLNLAIVALMYINKVKGTELDKVKADEYVKYVTEHVHPLMAQADRIAREAGENAKKEVDAAIDKVEEEKK